MLQASCSRWPSEKMWDKWQLRSCEKQISKINDSIHQRFFFFFFFNFFLFEVIELPWGKKTTTHHTVAMQEVNSRAIKGFSIMQSLIYSCVSLFTYWWHRCNGRYQSPHNYVSLQSFCLHSVIHGVTRRCSDSPSSAGSRRLSLGSLGVYQFGLKKS